MARDLLTPENNPTLTDLRTQPASASANGNVRVFEVSGNSYADGGLNPGFTPSIRRSRWPTQVAQLLGAHEWNIARDGAIAYRHEGATVGGHIATLNRKKPLRADGSRNKAAPYVASSELVALMRGVNDLGALGKNALEPFRQALITEITRYRAAAVFDVDDASITYSGAGWNAVTTYTGASDGKWRGANQAGASATINVPADFPGGTIALGFVVGAMSTGFGSSGRWDIKVDNGATVQYDLANLANLWGSYFGCPVIRLTGLSAGAHTITLTLGQLTPSALAAGFNYWSIEAPDAPPVYLMGQPRLPGSPDPSTNTDDASIVALNTMLRGVADIWTDGRVKFFDLDRLFNKQLDMFAADSLHPSVKAQSIIAQEFVAQVQKDLVTLQRVRPSVSLPWHEIGSPSSQTTFNSGWSSPVIAGYEPAAFRKNVDGSIIMRGLVRGTALNTVIFTLPEVFRPASAQTIACAGFDGTNRMLAWIYIDKDGLVYALTPGPSGGSSWIDLSTVRISGATS